MRWSRFMQSPWPAVGLVLLALGAHAPGINATWIWDDDQYVTASRAIRDWSGIIDIWTRPGSTPQYYPITFSTLWAQWQLVGNTPFWFHLLNMLLHAADAVLVWIVLGMWGVPGAWLTAALFAVHPVTVESVAWVAERKNVLSMFFYLLAMREFLRSEEPDGSTRHYALSFLLFAAALLSKTVTCTFPAAVGLLLWWRGTLTPRAVLRLLPFLLLGLGLAAVTVWMERHHVGAIGAEWNITLWERCLIAGRVVWFYAVSLLLPLGLNFNYERWTIDATSVAQMAAPISAVAVLLGLLAMTPRLGRGPFVAVAFFVGTLTPALGFFDVFPFRYSFVADHFQYHATLGLLALGGAALASAPPAVAAAVLGLGVALSCHRTLAFMDEETLWHDTIAKNPQSWLAVNNLGLLYATRGDTEGAVKLYHHALTIKADDSYALVNLGNAEAALGQMASAEARFRDAISFEPGNPQAHLGLGNILGGYGRLDEAIAEYRAALEYHPDYPEALNNLANVYVAQQQPDRAEESYRAAIKGDPDYPDPHRNLGLLLVSRGKDAEALEHFRRAVALDPQSAAGEHLLADFLAAHGNPGEAVPHYRAAVRLRPSLMEAQNGLGVALVKLGRPAESIPPFTAAAQLAPKDPNPVGNLGMALALAGRLNDAAPYLERAMTLGPPNASVMFHLARARRAAGRTADADTLFTDAARLARDGGNAALVAEIEKARSAP